MTRRERKAPPVPYRRVMKQGFTCRACAPLLLASATFAAEPLASIDGDGFLAASRGGETLLSWRKAPLSSPAGGAKFAGSAFFHPLRTPSGFELTTIQPSDHLHHFGVWWPWKFIEVNGTKHNTWEIQEKQGGHAAKSATALPAENGALRWRLENETHTTGPDGKQATAILETTTASFGAEGADAFFLDLDIRQKAAGAPVKIVDYRYSGFSWRGPASWNKDNSTMTTSGGKGREDANGTQARWVVVCGPTPKGKASLLMMSAASRLAGGEEKVRVWDSKAHNGTPFVNFNPVMNQALPLDEAHPAVSHRKYRIIAADREIDAQSAEAAWKKWTGS